MTFRLPGFANEARRKDGEKSPLRVGNGRIKEDRGRG